MGRIGLAISPVESRRRLRDRRGRATRPAASSARPTAAGPGRSVGDYVTERPQYYHELFADPKNGERVYSMDICLQVSDDGGKTFHKLGESDKHVDNHVHLDRPGRHRPSARRLRRRRSTRASTAAPTWQFKANLPVTQFYSVGAGQRRAVLQRLRRHAGQRHASAARRAPRNAHGIANADWFVTVGRRRLPVARSIPNDPNIVYAESQYGGLVALRPQDRRADRHPAAGRARARRRCAGTGTRRSSSARTRTRGSTSPRSASSAATTAATRWKPVSPDLTRQIDRNKLQGDGAGLERRTRSPRTPRRRSTATSSSLAESPKKEGLLYVGTDDGLIQVTRGRRRDLAQDRAAFPACPSDTYVSRLERLAARRRRPSTPPSTTTRTATSSRTSCKSADRGRTLDLDRRRPAGARHGLRRSPRTTVDPNLLFAGTEFGALLHASTAAQQWVPLKGGLPTIAVRDLAIQKRENDLVVATFGRGFYILDDYTPLRAATPGGSRAGRRDLPGAQRVGLRPDDPARLPRQGLPRRRATTPRRTRRSAPSSPTT